MRYLLNFVFCDILNIGTFYYLVFSALSLTLSSKLRAEKHKLDCFESVMSQRIHVIGREIQNYDII